LLTAVSLTDDLVAAAQMGDATGLAAVYGALAPAVVGYLAAKGVHDPEAVAQDVFLTVFSRLPDLSGGVSGLRTFVFSVAHARMVDHLRQRARHPDLLMYEPEWDRRVSESAEHHVVHNESEERALQLLSTLPEDQATVLSLRIIADLSIEQTASIIRRSPGAVKQLQRRALLNLRQTVTNEHVTQ
jgi:RNA polymerase sigma factor (sigma-70 family)